LRLIGAWVVIGALSARLKPCPPTKLILFGTEPIQSKILAYSQWQRSDRIRTRVWLEAYRWPDGRELAAILDAVTRMKKNASASRGC